MDKPQLLKVKRRARRRGKRAQVSLANYIEGENLGTLGGVDVRKDNFFIESKEKADIPGWFEAAWEQAKTHAHGKIPVVYFHKFYNKIEDDWIILNAYFFKRMLDEGLDEVADRVLRQMKKEAKEVKQCQELEELNQVDNHVGQKRLEEPTLLLEEDAQ